MQNGIRSDTSVRVGIVGCGGIAIGKHLPNLQKLSEVDLFAFCDLNREKASDAAKKFGVQDAKVYTDYEELLMNDSIDVVHICTPNDMHAEITIHALSAGKHVMCEKPMAKSASGARKMIEAARQYNRKLTIGYQNRFRPDTQYLHGICERGELGDIYFAKALAVRRRAVPTWGVFLDENKQGGGPLIDIGTHSLDLTLWLMNNYQPKYVVGTTYHKLSHLDGAANAFGPWDPKKFTVEDSAFGFIVMENGATVVLESSWALNTLQIGEAKVILCGTKGGADMEDGLRINGEAFGRLYTKKIELGLGGVDFYDGSMEQSPSFIETMQWIHCIMNDTKPIVKPEEALVVTEILESIYQSSKIGAPVFLK